MTRTFYFINGDNELSEKDFSLFKEYIEKRASHKPLQHILGKAYFYGYEFVVNENVLIPRQDTEVLVDEVMKLTSDSSRVLDMCTGSGCIIISLAAAGHTAECEYGAVGVDISDKAIEVAEYNSKLNGVPYVDFIKSNMFAELRDTGVKFDVIVSNPPYIPTKDIRELSDEVKLHDPLLALDGDEDGLKFYRAITRNAVDYLNKGGYLCYEIGYNQAQDVSDILLSCGYNDIRVVKDLAGLDRVVIARYY
jgi:release factor glutamine methyltransferase